MVRNSSPGESGSPVEATLRAYDAQLEAYRAGTPATVEGGLLEFLEGAFRPVPAGATVLELGSGLGRDALWLQGRGYDVIPTDAAESFLEELRSLGLAPRELNVLTAPFPRADAILANAVFLHIPREELPAVLRSCRAALPPGGRLVFALKRGAGDGSTDGWSSEKLGVPRWFSYWDEQSIIPELVRAGFHAVECDTDLSSPAPWLQLIAVR